MTFATCPIDRCPDPGPGPSGLCRAHAPLLPIDLTAQLRFGIERLLFATPADAALFLGLPFATVDEALVRLWKSHGPLSTGAGLVLSRSRQHLIPTAGEDLCCARCGTLVIPAVEGAPALYFIGAEGEETWVWSSRAPTCKPFVDGSAHAFAFTVADRPDRPGNLWTGTCARCGTLVTTTDDPHGDIAPRFLYRRGTGDPSPLAPPCLPFPGAS